MFSESRIPSSAVGGKDQIEALGQALEAADAVVIGAGAGLSASAGLTYDGERFERYFSDFQAKYGIRDMYSGGFYPFDSLEEYWAWWSRQILHNRYERAPRAVYDDLLALVGERDYFVLTTNVDHQFQLAGFDKKRLFYTQGDYGLWQCSQPCHQATYDNEEAVRRMAEEQRGRADDTFVQDGGWYAAAERYQAFLRRHAGLAVLYLELGVGMNTPGIIKYPFWRMTRESPRAVYACVNQQEAYVPREIRDRAVCVAGDIGDALRRLAGPGR